VSVPRPPPSQPPEQTREEERLEACHNAATCRETNGEGLKVCSVKVAYITMIFPAASETFAGTDIRALQASGVEVSVHAMRAPQSSPAALLAERGLASLSVTQGTLMADLAGLAACLARPLLLARVLAWLVSVTWRRPAYLAASLALLPRSMGILSELERESPDVVHLFWGHYPCIVGYLVLTALPNSLLSVFLGAYDLSRGYGGTAWVARRAPVVSTHAKSNFPAIQALGVPLDRIHLAYRGLDPALFNRHQERKTRYRIVCVGRLERDKGVSDVLLAFRAVRAKWPAATLMLLGDGEDRASLERLSRSLEVDDAVTFLGHVPHSDVASELAKAEVLLHMSLDERLPNVVKEAMASRCLCVVSETQGIDELVVDGRHGFVVECGNSERAAARIDDVFAGRVDVASLLDAASDHIARWFNVTESMRSYQRQWADALAAGRPGSREGVSGEAAVHRSDGPVEKHRTSSLTPLHYFGVEGSNVPERSPNAVEDSVLSSRSR
jgi:glycosyltransferase involved in cell wall biosynthesis